MKTTNSVYEYASLRRQLHFACVDLRALTATSHDPRTRNTLTLNVLRLVDRVRDARRAMQNA